MANNIYHIKFYKVYITLGFILFIWTGVEIVFFKSFQNVIPNLVVIFAIFYITLSVRIVTSPNGISYYNSNLYALHATWDNIEKIDFVELRLFGKQRCVFLKKCSNLGWWTFLAWASPKDDREKTIPIDGWSNADRLMTDIKNYVPRLNK